VNALLGLDARREAAVGVVSLGAGEPGPVATDIAPLVLATEPLSPAEIEYPLIWQTHAATSLHDCADVHTWRKRAGAHASTPPTTPVLSALPLETSIERRGSARRFSDAPLSLEALQRVLSAAQGSLRSDHALAGALLRPVLIANRVEGLERGVYGLDAHGGFSLLRPGDFAAEAAHLALDQPAAASAAANLYFVASMKDVASAMAERGYRAVQLEAGIRTGQVYLASSALGLRATGLTFYDSEVTEFLRLNAAEALVVMLVVFGP
jgi:nitroreductase